MSYFEASAGAALEAYSAQSVYGRTDTKKTNGTQKTDDVKKADYGKTVGEPKLSEEAQKYYEKLKKMYGNYDFILVSKDQKENAKANAASYANAFKPVVLIDEEKIERMATDKEYRKKYEAILSGAANTLSQMKSQLQSSGANVKGYGMQVDDGGTASFFAVLEESSAAQRERIEKKHQQNIKEKKAAEKKAAKKASEERLEKMRERNSSKVESDEEETKNSEAKITGNETVVSASSLEELLQKVGDFVQNSKMNSVLTEEEQAIGGHIDFKG